MATVGVVQIGGWIFPPPDLGEGVAIVKWGSAAKIDEKESDGQNDARTTFKGRLPGKVEITLNWREGTTTDDYAVQMLADISPRGPNAGKPFELVAKDQEVHNAHSIIAKDLKGPERTPGRGEASAVLSCDTWAKQKPTAVAKTPDKAEPWGGKPGPAVVNLVPDPPGFGSASSAPAVTP